MKITCRLIIITVFLKTMCQGDDKTSITTFISSTVELAQSKDLDAFFRNLDLIGVSIKDKLTAVGTAASMQKLAYYDLNKMKDSIRIPMKSIPQNYKNIEDNFAAQEIKSTFAKVQNLMEHLKMYAKKPNQFSRDEYSSSCIKYNMIDTMETIAEDISPKNPLLILFMKLTPGKYEVRLTNWARIITSISLQASILQEACVGISYANLKPKNDLGSIIEGVSDYLSDKINSISNAMQELRKQISKTNYLETAKEITSNLLQEGQSWSHDKFANELYDKLRKEFGLRNWVVISSEIYGQKWNEWMVWMYKKNLFHLKNEKRSVLVVASDEEGAEFDYTFEACLSGYKVEFFGYNEGARCVLNTMERCLLGEEVPFSGIVVVYSRLVVAIKGNKNDFVNACAEYKSYGRNGMQLQGTNVATYDCMQIVVTN